MVGGGGGVKARALGCARGARDEPSYAASASQMPFTASECCGRLLRRRGRLTATSQLQSAHLQTPAPEMTIRNSYAHSLVRLATTNQRRQPCPSSPCCPPPQDSLCGTLYNKNKNVADPPPCHSNPPQKTAVTAPPFPPAIPARCPRTRCEARCTTPSLTSSCLPTRAAPSACGSWPMARARGGSQRLTARPSCRRCALIRTSGGWSRRAPTGRSSCGTSTTVRAPRVRA
eukprot:132347-Chlamydomonas_euryale.AAC.2